MKDNNIENIVTLELVKEDELYKFKKDLQESFSVAVIEEFGSVDAGPIPYDEEIEKVLTLLEQLYIIYYQMVVKWVE